MSEKLIAIEEIKGPFQMTFKRLLRMVPDRDKADKNLQRLLAFRLMVDGESATREYVIRKIKEMIQCAYKGSFYDFIRDNRKSDACTGHVPSADAPD